MTLISQARTRYQPLSHRPPLPAFETDTRLSFQGWHHFDRCVNSWRPIDTANASNAGQSMRQGSEFLLVTWNVDYFSEFIKARLSAILSHVRNVAPAADIMFFQELPRSGLQWLLEDAWVRQNWVSSEAQDTNWEKRPFGSMILASRSRFSYGEEPSSTISSLGAIWRVSYPSRYERDALCCDILVPTPSSKMLERSDSTSAETASAGGKRVRLVNVHLDSLAIQPSHRPRQLAIVSSLLRSAGHGLVAGDFNPVLPEDDTLVADNGLVDAWAKLYPQDPGFTWGVDGKQEFPPNRMDKVATFGLEARAVAIMHPAFVTSDVETTKQQSGGQIQYQELEQDDIEKKVPWSDHSGLKCHFEVI